VALDAASLVIGVQTTEGERRMPDQSPVAVPAPTTVEVTDPTPGRDAVAPAPEVDLVEADLLVEDVSIDGMCGVY
jgi:mycofactocin precursor